MSLKRLLLQPPIIHCHISKIRTVASNYSTIKITGSYNQNHRMKKRIKKGWEKERRPTALLAVGLVFSSSSWVWLWPWVCWPTIIFSSVKPIVIIFGVRVTKSPKGLTFHFKVLIMNQKASFEEL